MVRASSRQWRWFLGAVVFGLAAWPTLASDLQLELTIRGARDSRPFVHRASLERTVADQFARAQSATVQDYLQQAKRAYAEKKGYREAIYGKDNWKMVQVDDWSWKVVDGGSGRTVSSGGRSAER